MLPDTDSFLPCPGQTDTPGSEFIRGSDLYYDRGGQRTAVDFASNDHRSTSMPFEDLFRHYFLDDDWTSSSLGSLRMLREDQVAESPKTPFRNREGTVVGDNTSSSQSVLEMLASSGDSLHTSSQGPLATVVRENNPGSSIGPPESSQSRESPKNLGGPHMCADPKCTTTRPFADRAGFLRHKREVHGEATVHGRPPVIYYCPSLACKRHRLGFSRRWNLTQDQKRVHESPKGQARVPGTRRIGSPGLVVGPRVGGELAGIQEVELDREEYGDGGVHMGVAGLETLESLEDFRAELKKQEMEKARLEGQVAGKAGLIATLRAACTLIEGTRPSNS